MIRPGPIVVAFGGNAMLRPGEPGTAEQQITNALAACAPLAKLVARGERLVLVHGNGPQVGRELERSQLAEGAMPPLSLAECVAATQGVMGYFLETAMRRALAQVPVEARIAALVTSVLVDPADPAFRAATKPIGVGVRRQVASPVPRQILDGSAIQALVDAGHLVIAGGGGGIPVVRGPDGRYRGVDAVVDKDHTAALIGRELGARTLIDLTAVDFVYQDFGGARPTPLPRLTPAEARRLLADGQFPPGSMGPKIEAALSFLEGGGESVLISSMARLDRALAGEIGSWIVRPGGAG